MLASGKTRRVVPIMAVMGTGFKSPQVAATVLLSFK
jgi:hypothetical protein